MSRGVWQRGTAAATGARRAILLASAAVVALVALACIPPGTYPRPACTQAATPGSLQAAINAAGPGTVICMGPGVFQGSLVFQGKSGVTLRGQGTGATVVAGGAVDGVLVFNSQGLTFQDFMILGGHPTDAYISNSSNIAFQGVSAAGGGIGLHFDNASSGSLTSSTIYSAEADGVLIRHGSSIQADRSLIFNNGGAGVSAVGNAGAVTLSNTVVSHNAGPGVFTGQPPCAGLAGGSLDVPACYLANPQAFISGITLALNATTVQDNGSTGVVLFPGTTGTLRGTKVIANRLTGLFAWGATITSQGDEFSGNEEHGAELRSYPSPLQAAVAGASGSFVLDDVHDSIVLAATGTLGGGLLAQGARMDVANSRVHNNRGIGISFVNGATGSVNGDQVYNNGGSAVCLSNTGAVAITGDAISGNASNAPGICLETP